MSSLSGVAQLADLGVAPTEDTEIVLRAIA
jgi:hypothetical protein